MIRGLQHLDEKGSWVGIESLEALWEYGLHISAMAAFVAHKRSSQDEATVVLRDYLTSLKVVLEADELANMDSIAVARHAGDHVIQLMERVLNEEVGAATSAPMPTVAFSVGIRKRMLGADFLGAVTALRTLLSKTRCLVVVDNVEKILWGVSAYYRWITAMVEATPIVIGQFKQLNVKCMFPAEAYDAVTWDNPRKYGQRTVVLRWSYRDLLLMLV